MALCNKYRLPAKAKHRQRHEDRGVGRGSQGGGQLNPSGSDFFTIYMRKNVVSNPLENPKYTTLTQPGKNPGDALA